MDTFVDEVMGDNLGRFVLTTAAVALIPGPSMALISGCSVRSGRRVGLLAAAGTACACLVLVILVTYGGGNFIASHPRMKSTITGIYALYMVVLAVILMKPTSEIAVQNPVAPAGNGQLRGSVAAAGAFAATAVNPQVALFYFLFLPQFVATGHRAQLVTLGVAACLVSFSVNAVIACTAARFTSVSGPARLLAIRVTAISVGLSGMAAFLFP